MLSKVSTLSYTRLAVLALCLIAIFSSVSCRKFDLGSFCTKQCNIGRGGNLCRCNAFHFAGKRSGTKPFEQGLQLNRNIGSRLKSKGTPNSYSESLQTADNRRLAQAVRDHSKTSDHPGFGGVSETTGEGERPRTRNHAYQVLLDKVLRVLRNERYQRT